MRVVPLIALSMMAAPGSAAVVAASDHGFEVQHSVNLVVPQAQAFTAFGQIGQWWNNEHTYSGDGKRMSLQMRPGGCFCEPLDGGGGIEHMRVTYVQPGERVVLTGSLGPLPTCGSTAPTTSSSPSPAAAPASTPSGATTSPSASTRKPGTRCSTRRTTRSARRRHRLH